MSSALERLKLLMGGEEAFKQAEVSATNLQHDESQHECNHTETHAAQAPQTSQKPRTETTTGHESIRKWTKVNASSDVNKQYWCSALHRAQRYLGLRGSSQEKVPAQDYTQPSSHVPYLDPIILSLDIEADETDHSIVTEIGISTLDTRSLHNLAPGPQCKSWLSQIQGQHFRIAEHTHIRNHLFVTGNPEAFSPEFGTSQIIPLDQIEDTVRACFLPNDQSSQPLRNILLIGHNIKSDITWLRHLGIDLLTIPNLLEVLDTEDLQKALKHNSQGGTTLARLLAEMDNEACDLHNAGNDAAYTLQAFVAIVLKSLSDARPVVGLEERVREAVAKATERAMAEWKSWVVAEERSDGNRPVAYRVSKFRG